MAGWEEAEEVGRAALEGWYRTLDVEGVVVLQVQEKITEPGNGSRRLRPPRHCFSIRESPTRPPNFLFRQTLHSAQ